MGCAALGSFLEVCVSRSGHLPGRVLFVQPSFALLPYDAPSLIDDGGWRIDVISRGKQGLFFPTSVCASPVGVTESLGRISRMNVQRAAPVPRLCPSYSVAIETEVVRRLEMWVSREGGLRRGYAHSRRGALACGCRLYVFRCLKLRGNARNLCEAV